MSSVKSTSISVMRPPKPPCWRDFVAPNAKSITSEGVEVAESLGRSNARSTLDDLIDVSRSSFSLPGNKPSRLARRPRAKIHRTRSEHIIHAEELPDVAFTGTLADADPKGLRSRMSEGCLYVEENNRRCQNWLASIEAAEPLDAVDYTSEASTSTRLIASDIFSDSHNGQTPCNHVLIPISEQNQQEEVEVPEETFVWDVSLEDHQDSSSSDEEICSICRMVNPQKHSTLHHTRSCPLHPSAVHNPSHRGGQHRLNVRSTQADLIEECEGSQDVTADTETRGRTKFHQVHTARCTVGSSSGSQDSDTMTLTLGQSAVKGNTPVTRPKLTSAKRASSAKNVFSDDMPSLD